MALIFAMEGVEANPSLVVDVDSGDVLYQDMATVPWFPASTTKLMTVYVALSAVREGRITFDTPLMVSPRAAAMPPSKMGFRPGTLVTLDNALKMLMVKSPNDVAVTIAEGVSGSVEAFANDMNVYAARLGLHESHFVNPNGLPDDRHMSSARDMAMIGRALLQDFPEQRGLFGIGVLAFGRQLINNHNGLLGRYPGVDGMKTGFTCAAGYNVVASAEANGRHVLTVIMGAPSTGERNGRAAALFDRFLFGGGASLGKLDSLPTSDVMTPPDNHDTVCGRGRHTAIAEAEAEDAAIPLAQADVAAQDHSERAFLLDRSGQGTAAVGRPESHLSPIRAAFEPVHVFIGPVAGWTGRVAQAIGNGAKELNPAPVKTVSADRRTPSEQGSVQDAPVQGGAIEGAAPGPLALVGATPVAPAALATRRFVKATKSLSLAVGSTRRDRSRHARESSKPQATASTEPAAKQPAAAPLRRGRPAVPATVAKAARPVADAKVKASKRSAVARQP